MTLRFWDLPISQLAHSSNHLVAWKPSYPWTIRMNFESQLPIPNSPQCTSVGVWTSWQGRTNHQSYLRCSSYHHLKSFGVVAHPKIAILWPHPSSESFWFTAYPCLPNVPICSHVPESFVYWCISIEWRFMLFQKFSTDWPAFVGLRRQQWDPEPTQETPASALAFVNSASFLQ